MNLIHLQHSRDSVNRRLLSLLLAFTLLFGFLPGAAQAEALGQTQSRLVSTASLQEEELYEGLSFGKETVQNDDGQNVNTFVTTVDTNVDSLTFAAGTPNDAPLEKGLCQTTSGQAKAALMGGKNVLAAVNADYFNIGVSTAIQPQGLTIKDGKLLVGPFAEDRYFFGVKKDGTPVIGKQVDYETVGGGELEQAVGGRNCLVKDGVVQEINDTRNPRTAVGITADNKVLLVVADGRTDASAGFKLGEMGKYLKSLGAVQALELDGGGSSASVIRDPDHFYSFDVQNYPSDGSERPVGDTLLVVGTDGFTADLDKDTDGYYLIQKAADFAQINKAPDQNFRLANDIDFTGSAVPAVDAFTGDFDGNGHVISGLKLTEAVDPEAHALFGITKAGSRIRNLRLSNVYVHSDLSNTAALVGDCSGTIENVTVTGRVYGGGQVGGIIGSLRNGGYIRRCSAGVDVVGTGGQVGGIAGFNDGGIEACYANVNVQGAYVVGGIAGFSDIVDDTRYVRNNIAEGHARATGVEVGGVGGLLKMRATNNIVKNMTVTGTSTLAVNRGNAAGLLGAWMEYSQVAVTGNVMISGSVTTVSPGAGTRVGYASGTAHFQDNYANPAIMVNGQTVTDGTASNNNGADLTAEQMTSKDFFAGLGFDFENVFDWDADAKTPVLRGVDQTVQAPIVDPVINIGADETQRLITWYSNSNQDEEFQLAPVSAVKDGVFPADHKTFQAVRTDSSMVGFSNYKAAVTGLAADTEYAYRVGSGNRWSTIYRFSTEGFEQNSFSFLFAGDPQIGSSGNVGNDAAGWNATLEKAASWFPDSSFMISAGDQVEHYYRETQYAGYLAPDYLRSHTLATNIGNHDSGGAIYREHFSVPNPVASEGDTNAGGDYWYSYNGVLFLSLNSNNISTAQHKAFLEGAIQAYKDRNGGKDPGWKIVTFHHSVYSTASHTQDTDIIQRRAELPVVLSELGIDAVLMGHDHVYTRSFMMDGTTPVTAGYTADGDNQYAAYTADPEKKEVFYLTANSSSGSKFYAIKNLEFPFKAVDNQESVPNLTKIDVTDGALTFTTYRTGTDNQKADVVDTFTLNRVVPPAVTTADLPDGAIGAAYSQTLAAEGSEPFTWNVESGNLPDGLTLSSDGVLSGTPTKEGAFTFTVKATNAAGSAIKVLSINVKVEPAITTADLPDGAIGSAYSQTLAAQGSTPITWSVESGNLPDGLTLAADGTLSGMPTKDGTFTFTVKATNSAGFVTKELSLKVDPAAPVGTKPTITVSELPAGTAGKAYSRTLTADGDAPITWSVESGNLPDGLTLAADGTLSGTPTKDGTFTFTVKAENDAGSATKELSLKIDPAAPAGTKPTITVSELPAGTAGKVYSRTLTAGGDAPITWSVESGNLPDGLTLAADGTLSGTPTKDGTFTFTVKATNSAGSVTKELSLKIDPAAPAGTKPTITVSELPAGTAGKAYSRTLTADGDAPITWSVESGNLPDGLTLAADGILSGTPTKDGTFTFTVKAENGAGSATKELNLKVGPVPQSGANSQAGNPKTGSPAEFPIIWIVFMAVSGVALISVSILLSLRKKAE